MNYANTLEKLLTPMGVDDKFKLFDEFYRGFKDGSIKVEIRSNPIVFDQPSYAGICTIVSLGKVKRTKDLQTTKGKISLLHAIMHIEFSAIDLALDAAYRFRSMPSDFYSDWLEVANEEIGHFKLLRDLIRSIGADYGDDEVHDGLFQACKSTQDLITRMAIIPRNMEANGLDANLHLRHKISKLKPNQFFDELLNVLAIIERDEISHVQKGDRWFKYACKIEGLDPQKSYLEILKKHGEGAIKREMNIKARKKAGFSCYELNQIAGKEVCD